MRIQKKVTKKTVKAASRLAKRAVRANEEVVEDEIIEDADVEVAPEASDLLFEAEDVAELIAEVTGQDVEVTADEDAVTFAVGEDEFVVEAEGEEEILESTKRPLRGKAPVKASKRAALKRRTSRR